MYIYSFPVSANLSKISIPIKKTVDAINDSMAFFGYYEKMVIKSVVLNIQLKSDDKLGEKVLDSFRKLSQKHLDEKFPEYEYVVEPLENIKII